MQRTGVRAASAIDFLQYIKSLQSLELVGMYSHFATADSPDGGVAQKQVEIFTELAKLPFLQEPPVVVHMANSGGTAYLSDSHFHMVRPAQLSFGFYFEKTPPQFTDLSSCFSVKAKISYFKVVAAGQGISYGHTYVTSKQTRIVTIPVGYGDGYPRILSNRGSVLIRGKRFPIVGTICMDQFMVDVGEQEVYVGEEAVLIGKQGEEEISLWEVAKLCDTIPNEILCGFNDRIPKVYHGK
jgi:alanine racemase